MILILPLVPPLPNPPVFFGACFCLFVLLPFLKMGSKERADAKKEVKVLAKMKHPNIVAYCESFEE